MILTQISRHALVTAILPSGEEKNLILSTGKEYKTIYKVRFDDFVSVHISPIGFYEISRLEGIEKFKGNDIDLNILWLVPKDTKK